MGANYSTEDDIGNSESSVCSSGGRQLLHLSSSSSSNIKKCKSGCCAAGGCAAAGLLHNNKALLGKENVQNGVAAASAVAGKERDVNGNNDNISSNVKLEILAKHRYDELPPERRTKLDQVCEILIAKLKHEESILFKQPPPNEDCPICMIPLPSLEKASTYYSCCGKMICSGCIYALTAKRNKKGEMTCPFCRTPSHYTAEQYEARLQKRMEANDAIALHMRANHYRCGQDGMVQDYSKAFELFIKASNLGHAGANCNLGYAYETGYNNNGNDVVERNMQKSRYYYKLAALDGDVRARHNLGAIEERAGNIQVAIKHYIMAARGGNSNTLPEFKRLYSDGKVTKDEYTNALRLYQAYLMDVKSVKRDEAAKFDGDKYRYY